MAVLVQSLSLFNYLVILLIVTIVYILNSTSLLVLLKVHYQNEKQTYCSHHQNYEAGILILSLFSSVDSYDLDL